MPITSYDIEEKSFLNFHHGLDTSGHTLHAGILSIAYLSSFRLSQSSKMSENAKKGPKIGPVGNTDCDSAKPTPDTVLPCALSTTVFFPVGLGLLVRERGPAA